ncbi:MAG TPA: VCBS repeat-containing protein, partial [Polyangiaceae bacterium]
LSGGLALGGPSATPGAALTGKSVPIGKLISHGGDVNHDGIPDLLVSGASSPLQNGRVFVVLGAKSLTSADIDSVPGLFVIQSDAANDLLPESLDYVGNVDNADGDEIAMTNHSSVLMVRGTTRGGMYPSSTGPLSGSGDTGGGWSYMLQNQLDTAAVAGAGDVDGDPPHSADLLICEADTSDKMACRVVLGPPKTLSAGWNIAGFSEKEPPHLAHGADINGDGHSDLLFGEASKVYAVLGKRLPLPDVDVTALGDAGFTLTTEGSERVDSVTTLGDVNGDGALDYAVGVSSASQGAGSVYVVFGSQSGG